MKIWIFMAIKTTKSFCTNSGHKHIISKTMSASISWEWHSGWILLSIYEYIYKHTHMICHLFSLIVQPPQYRNINAYPEHQSLMMETVKVFVCSRWSTEKALFPSSIQINHQPDATISQFIIRTFIYSSTCFGRSPAHHQELNDCSGSLWFYLRIVVTVVLCSWSGRL